MTKRGSEIPMPATLADLKEMGQAGYLASGFTHKQMAENLTAHATPISIAAVRRILNGEREGNRVHRAPLTAEEWSRRYTEAAEIGRAHV